MGENLQSSALGLVFRISRVMGVAPVTFSRSNLHLSRQLVLWSILLFTILNCMLLVGLVYDFKVAPGRRIRVQTKSSSLVWITNMTNIMLISIVGVYFAPYRIKSVTKVLDAVEKMKKILTYHKMNNKNDFDKKLRVCFVYFFISNVGLVLSDVYKYTEITINEDKEVKVLILYLAFYYEYLCFTLFECQFIVVAFEIRNVLALVTHGLEDLLTTESAQSKGKSELSVNGKYFRTNVNVININSYVDNLSAGVLYVEKHSDRLEAVVHDLATVFGDACDLIREVNTGFGLQLLLILMNFFLELIVTPFYLMSAISDTSDRDASYLVLQVLWILYHLTAMCVAVEPAYVTQLEIEKTEYLVSRYLRQMKPYDPVSAELKVFTRQLVFNKAIYSPMGVCTLSRQLCVSVLGSVTTYLVIILQFRANEK